ncbi:hypothetical protein LZ31DRAFT_318676 [Colletotrichum somersetense]|nr:hypothetical protein LZ31DRAFT_318676 [Colletotrichum somersetense]
MYVCVCRHRRGNYRVVLSRADPATLVMSVTSNCISIPSLEAVVKPPPLLPLPFPFPSFEVCRTGYEPVCRAARVIFGGRRSTFLLYPPLPSPSTSSPAAKQPVFGPPPSPALPGMTSSSARKSHGASASRVKSVFFFLIVKSKVSPWVPGGPSSHSLRAAVFRLRIWNPDLEEGKKGSLGGGPDALEAASALMSRLSFSFRNALGTPWERCEKIDFRLRGEGVPHASLLRV